MPRITVITDTPADSDEPAILLDERVQSVHLSSGHAAAQLVERLAWAIVDAESSEAERSGRPADSTTTRLGRTAGSTAKRGGRAAGARAARSRRPATMLAS
jgi:hypothetical protein